MPREPFAAGNRSLFLCSSCFVIPSLVFAACVLPSKWPVVAGVQGLISVQFLLCATLLLERVIGVLHREEGEDRDSGNLCEMPEMTLKGS